MEGGGHSPAAAPTAAPAAAAPGEGWRLKFLHKVGVAGDNKPSDAPDDGAPRADSGASSSADDQVSSEAVVVRQVVQPRSSDDIRLGYIKKLERSRAFIPQLSRPKTAQTVTIFDWDDTLLCTTHLEMLQRQHGAIPAAVREQLATLETVVASLITQAKVVGKTFIITNASEGWVQHSAAMCMPGLSPLLEDLPIISARAGFEASFPGDSHAWKMHAFMQVQNKLHLEA